MSDSRRSWFCSLFFGVGRQYLPPTPTPQCHPDRSDRHLRVFYADLSRSAVPLGRHLRFSDFCLLSSTLNPQNASAHKSLPIGRFGLHSSMGLRDRLLFLCRLGRSLVRSCLLALLQMLLLLSLLLCELLGLLLMLLL